MTTDDRNVCVETAGTGLSSAEFALEPRSFVKRLAEKMTIDIDEVTLQRLTDRIKQGVSREQIIASLRNIKGVDHPIDMAAAALTFARTGQPGAALIVENITSFAPQDDKAFVLHAYWQVLDRRPGEVELARLTHDLTNRTLHRLDIIKWLASKSIEEGRAILWDSALGPPIDGSAGDDAAARVLIGETNLRSLSQDSSESLSLCSYTDGKWQLAASMVPRIDEIRADSWIVSDGFILTGPRSHLSAGKWLLELDIVQPDWASIIVDVVANIGVDRLLHITAHGCLRGSFVFEKLNTHAFLEVRLRISDARQAQWISIQNIRLKKVDQKK